MVLRLFGAMLFVWVLASFAKVDFWEWRDLYSTPREVVGLVRYATRAAPTPATLVRGA